MFLSARAQAFIDFAPSKFTEMATSIGLQGGWEALAMTHSKRATNLRFANTRLALMGKQFDPGVLISSRSKPDHPRY